MASVSMNTSFSGGGTCGELIRSRNWNETELGSPEQWPDSLTTALSISLNSGFPIAIYWGKSFNLLYNDAYSVIAGDKHPQLLGAPAHIAWSEIWHLIEKQFNDVLEFGETVRAPDAMLPMKRFGYTEECYFDYTLSPVIDTTGSIRGIFNAAVESTYKVINERRNRLLHELGMRTGIFQALKPALHHVLDPLYNNPADLPFALLYIADATTGDYTLTQAVNASAAATGYHWPFELVSESGNAYLVKELDKALPGIAQVDWPEPLCEAVILPLQLATQSPSGFLVAGINPGKRVDDNYISFLETVVSHIRNTINDAFHTDNDRQVARIIRQRDDELQFAINAAELGTWDLDPASNKFAGNNRLKAWFGLPPDAEVPLSMATDVIDKRDHARVLEAINRAMQFDSGGDYDIRYTIRNPQENQPRLVRARGKALFNERQEIVRFSGTLQDITSEEQARVELERAFEQVRLSKEAAQLGTFDVDYSANTLEWDQRCRHLFGITHNDPVSIERDFFPGLYPDDRDMVHTAMADAHNESLTGGDYDVEYRTVGVADGRIRWVRAKGKVFFNAAHEPLRFIGSVLEITEQKETELRKNDFIGMVSHELKTPLTSLKAYTQLLNERAKANGDDFEKNALMRVEVQVNKMTSMVNSFLNVARLESGHIQLVRSKFDIRELISEVLADLAIIHTSHEITVTHSPEVFVNADREKIGQVLINLIGNAVKYSAKGTAVTISMQSDDHEVVVAVKDQGIGIHPQDLEKLFTRFYRVQNAKTKTISGFGIGLYLSAEIVRRHDGRIWVESIKGEGSSFHFSLPLAD